jgi:hypothetical protein
MHNDANQPIIVPAANVREGLGLAVRAGAVAD